MNTQANKAAAAALIIEAVATPAKKPARKSAPKTLAQQVAAADVAPRATAKQIKDAKSAAKIRADVASQMAKQPKVDHSASNKMIAKLMKGSTEHKAQIHADIDAGLEGKVAPAIPTTGYTGPMRALRDRVKAGKYTKAANGQPSCGDETAQILGHLEPAEVIKACMIAMDLNTNPYAHLNIGQQSMNLRNKLRGMMKRGEFGMGVLREAVEVVMESRPAKAEK